MCAARGAREEIVGFGESPEGGFARIIGVALDVTEERLAQARAQSAESRLRDAIESTSEAFVLWDRNGRLVMCNKNFRSYFQLDPEILKTGVGREQVEGGRRLNLARRIGEQGVEKVEQFAAWLNQNPHKADILVYLYRE